jgi:hypothetical protein
LIFGGVGSKKRDEKYWRFNANIFHPSFLILNPFSKLLPRDFTLNPQLIVNKNRKALTRKALRFCHNHLNW